MIDKQGNLRCDGCGKKLGEQLEGHLEIVCPRCKRFGVFDSYIEAIATVTLDN